MKSSESEYITIGKILSHHGTGGKIKVEVSTDFPERFSESSIVYLRKQPATIQSTEWYKDKVIIKLDVVNNIEEAEKLKGMYLEIHESQLHELAEGSYYHFQLIGMEVQTNDGKVLGEITEILTGSSNDNYIINGDKGEILVPAVEDIVKSINLETGIMIIEPIEGLLSLNYKVKGKND